MKVNAVFSALAMASLTQASLLEEFEKVITGNVGNLLPDLSEGLSPGTAATKMLNDLKSVGIFKKLGAVPTEALAAWESVVADIPDGATKLRNELFKQAQRVSDKHHSAKKHGKPAKGELKYSAETASKWKYTTQDERFPYHGLRIKSPEDLGIDKVKQYSGYFDVDENEEKHLFFWFFESRDDPANDPVVLWLNGGPGCSSQTGLFFELGPASIGEDLKPVHNPHSWNNHANVIFLDQPVGTGYSYTDGPTVSDTVTASKDVYAFLELFFKQFPEYAGRDFHISGESYGGHYIPVFASEIVSHDERSFNLTSLLIGNGLTDPLRQYDLYEPMACGLGGHPSVLEEDKCQGMIDSQPRCNQLIETCYNTKSAWTCVPASVYCNNVMFGPYQETGLNVYDIRESCEDSSSGLCYPQLEYLTSYLNQDEVKEAVGAEVETFKDCNFDVNGDFLFHGDWMQPYYTAVSELLEKEVPILIYAGDKDYICNWLGNEAWSRELPWSGHDEFAGVELSPWVLKDGTEVGQKRNHEHFTFLRVYEAGHMVPFNQPEAASVMLERWLSGDFTFE